MGVLVTLLIGLIVGAVAQFLLPGKDPGGILLTILLGIAGSLVGTWLGRTLGFYGPGQTARFIASVVGAMLILLVYRVLRGRTA